jgi:hypothetical protein
MFYIYSRKISTLEQNPLTSYFNRIFEKGILKCHQYWPEPEGSKLESDELAEVGLMLEHVSSQSGKHYTVRTLR